MAAGILLFGVGQANAHRSPSNCGGAGVGVQVFKFRQDGVTVANTVTNGERVVYVIQVQNDTQLATPSGIVPVCDVTCASVLFRCPDSSGNPGPQIMVATNVNLPFGTGPFVAGSVTCVVSVASSITSARAHVDVLGVVHDLTIPTCTPDATCVINACDPDTGGGQQEVSVTVRTPCIDVTKQCVSAVNVGGNAVVVSFTGSVSNCGNETLVNVGITNNQPVAGTLVTNISSLAAGQVINFSGTYTNTSNICGPFPDTVTATGTGVGSLGIVTDSASAQCTITYSPSISVTKLCPAVAPAPGGVLTFSGTVCNTGNIALTNVTVVDNQTLTTGGNLVANFPLLTNGECRNFTGSISVPANVCSITDTLTARGTNICSGVGVVNTATTNCPVACAPSIKVYKQVVCYSNACEPFSSDLNSQKSATGVSAGADCPAFCYRITVTNNGNVALSNLVIFDANSSDGKVLNLSGCGFPATLAVGASANCIVTTNHCVNSTNIVTATALGLVSGGGGGTTTVSSTDTNRVTVNPISVACRLLVSVNNGATFAEYHSPNCATQLISQPYIIRVVVTNTGSYGLQNVIVSDTAGTLGTCLATPRTIASLPTGSASSFDCTNTCAAGSLVSYSVSVSAVASQSQGHVCDFNLQGTEIKATSSCDTCVSCVGQPAIKVYKQVVCYSNICEPFSANLDNQKTATGVSAGSDCPAFCYRITVTNSGSVTLSNLVIFDSNSSDGKVLNLSGCGFPTTLAVGASASCTVTTNHCVNSTNVVTASGVGQGSSGNQTVSSTDTNRVTVIPISVACKLLVSINNGATFSDLGSTCAKQVTGASYIIRVVVTNTGSYPLQNVTVSDTAGTLASCVATHGNIGSLGVGASSSFDCTNTCSTPSTNNFAISISAEASQSQGHICAYNTAGQLIRATSSCSTCVACAGLPRICVTKEVVCELPTGCTNNWSHFATSAKTSDNSQCPSFCYRVRVTNCGEEALNSVTVTDNKLNLAACNFPATLAVGQTVECILAGVEHCQNVTNTVTASGVGASSGIGVSTNDTAAVVVLPISITCNVTVNGKPHEAIPCDGLGHLITNAVEVCNTGSLPLSDIVIDAPELVALGCTNVTSLRLSLLPGQCTNVVLCTDLVTCQPDCSLAFSNHIRITATVDQTLTNLCSWTRNPGNQVVAVTASTECTATVECIPQPKTGCTPGFWKNCTIHWQPTGYRPDQSVSSVFSLGTCCTSLGNLSLMGALNLGGGSGVCGGAQNLLRAAVAALLNGSSPELDYPFSQQEVIALVNAALQSCDRSAMLALASELDRDNNLGCGNANGGLPCHRLSDIPRIAPTRILDNPRVAPTRQ